MTQQIEKAIAILVAGSPGSGQSERGDVPGWVLVTVCTAVMVVAIFDIAGDELASMLKAALAKVH